MFYYYNFTSSARAIVAAVAILFCLNASAQTFQKTYGGSSEEYVYSVEQLSDGGYIMCGRSITGTINSSWDSQVIRLNASGDTLWTKNYGNVGYDELQSVKPTADGGFILTGQTDVVDFAGDVHLLKLNSNGTVSWSKAYGAAGTSDFGYSVRQTADGGYIIAGLTASTGAGLRDALLIKTDASGVVTWSKTYGGTADDEARSVEQTADGGYILSGYTLSYGSGAQGYVVKVNSTGTVSWSKTFGGSNTEVAYSVKQLTDGSFIVAGYTDSYGAGNFDFLLMKLASDGTTTWSRTYGGTNEDRALSVQVTSDGGFIMGGKTLSYGGGNSDYFLVKVNSSAVVTWAKAYGGTALDQAYSVIQTADGGYALTGYANSYGAGSKDGYLIKTDANGVSGCSEVSATPTTGSSTVTAGSGVTQGNVGVSLVTPTTAVRKTTMSVGTQCFTAGNTVCPVNAAFTSSATTICQGATVTFTNTTTGGAIGQGWYENNTLFSTSTSTQRTFNNAGTFTIQLIATNGTCQDTATATITVNPSVTPSVSITSNPASPICAGTSVTFTATPVNGGNPTYQWYNGVTLLPNVNGATYTTTGLTNGAAISVVMTSTAACASPATATSNTITYTVNPSVTPSVSITSNPPSPICAGTSVTFTATPVNGGTPTYQWYNGVTLIPNVTGATYTTTGLTNGAAISVVMTSTASCASPATATSNTITYNVLNAPVASFTTSANTICAGATITFTNTTTGAIGQAWDENNVLFSTAVSPTRTFNTVGSYQILLTSTNGTCQDTATATIVVNPIVSPNVTVSSLPQSPICAGTCVTFTATPGNGGNNPAYSWTINNAPVGQNSATYTTCTLANNDVVTVTLTSDAACASPATATSSPITYTVKPIPAQPVITVNGGSLQSSMPTGNQWYMTGGPTVLGTNQTYIPTQDGYYSVSYTDANGCTSLSDSVYFDITGIAEYIENTGIVIYPNPANDVITLSTNKNQGAVYSLFDGLGRVVLSGNFTAENTNINIGGLAPGMYILTVNGDNSRSYKVMKQ